MHDPHTVTKQAMTHAIVWSRSSVLRVSAAAGSDHEPTVASSCNCSGESSNLTSLSSERSCFLLLEVEPPQAAILATPSERPRRFPRGDASSPPPTWPFPKTLSHHYLANLVLSSFIILVVHRVVEVLLAPKVDDRQVPIPVSYHMQAALL